MRPFITVAARVAVATSDPLDLLVQDLTSWERWQPAGPAAKSPGFFVFLMGHASRVAAYRLQDGSYCREVVARVSIRAGDHQYYLLPSKTNITCEASECKAAFDTLMPIKHENTSIDPRCLVPQRALGAVGERFPREFKLRPVHGSDEYVRLELPGSGMPCVRLKCSGQSQCKLTTALIPMCTDDKPSLQLSVSEIFSAVSDHSMLAASEVAVRGQEAKEKIKRKENEMLMGIQVEMLRMVEEQRQEWGRRKETEPLQ